MICCNFHLHLIDKNVLIAGGSGVQLYGVLKREIKSITKDFTLKCAFNQDNSLLFSSSKNRLHVWDTKTFEPIKRDNDYALVYRTMTPCPNKEHIFTGRFGSANIQNWETAEIICSWNDRNCSLMSCLSHNKRYVAVSTDCGFMIVDSSLQLDISTDDRFKLLKFSLFITRHQID